MCSGQRWLIAVSIVLDIVLRYWTPTPVVYADSIGASSSLENLPLRGAATLGLQGVSLGESVQTFPYTPFKGGIQIHLSGTACCLMYSSSDEVDSSM